MHILASAIALTTRMLSLTYIIAVPAFDEVTGLLSFPVILLLFFVFSLVYAGIWCFFSRKIQHVLNKLTS